MQEKAQVLKFDRIGLDPEYRQKLKPVETGFDFVYIKNKLKFNKEISNYREKIYK